MNSVLWLYHPKLIWDDIAIARYSLNITTTSIANQAEKEEHRTYTSIFIPDLLFTWKMITTFYVVNPNGQANNNPGTEQDSVTLFDMIQTEFMMQEEALSSGECDEYTAFWIDNTYQYRQGSNGDLITCKLSDLLDHLCTKPYADFRDYYPQNWVVRGDVMIGNYELNWLRPNVPKRFGNWTTVHIKDEGRWKYQTIILNWY